MDILTAFPFPFNNPLAHELVRHMASQFTAEQDALAFAEKHGVDTLKVQRGLSPINMWRALLQQAAIAGTTRNLVQEARDLQPKNPRVGFLDALLAGEAAPISAPPRKGPSFGGKVSEKEALLFFDDLTIEIGQIAPLIATLTVLARCAPAVCRLRVKTASSVAFGTGFRIGKETILTNEHVLVPESGSALSVLADFGFEVDGAGSLLAGVTLAGELTSVVADANDDWGVIKVVGMHDAWPILKLDEALVPQPNEPAYVLQHPSGQTKRLGFVRNLITDVNQKAIEYLTDTESGSSGSPVFDASGRVIALHYLGGEPVAIPGKGPVSKNEGIRISRVIQGLKARGVVI